MDLIYEEGPQTYMDGDKYTDTQTHAQLQPQPADCTTATTGSCTNGHFYMQLAETSILLLPASKREFTFSEVMFTMLEMHVGLDIAENSAQKIFQAFLNDAGISRSLCPPFLL